MSLYGTLGQSSFVCTKKWKKEEESSFETKQHFKNNVTSLFFFSFLSEIVCYLF